MNGRTYRDLAIWTVAVVAVIANAAVAHFNIDRMARTEQETVHVRSVQLELTELLSSIKDAETGHRGFLLTERPEYLDPYTRAERSYHDQFAATQALLADDPAAVERLKTVERLATEKFAEMRTILDVWRAQGRERAVELMAVDQGRRLMDDLRQSIDELLAAQNRALDDRTRAGRENLRLARITGILGAMIAVGVVLVASSLIQKELNRRFKVNKELRESEGRFRNLAEAMPQIVWVTRPDGYHEYYNQRWYDYTGLTREQSLGWEWSAPLHRDDRERSQIRWKRSTDTGESYEIKYRFRRHDGEYRWFLGRAEPVRNAQGAIVRWLGTCTDIDDQVRAAQQLQESESYLRSVLENSPDCVKILDVDGRLLDMNGPGLQAMEVDDFNSIRGCPWPTLWPDDLRETVRGAIASATSGAVKRFSALCPTAKGTEKFWDVIVAPIPDARGLISRIVSVSRDVTERVRAEQRIQESAYQFRQLTEGLPLLIWSCTAEGWCDYLSLQWVRYTGVIAEEHQGYEWIRAVHPDDREATSHAWRTATETKTEYSVEYRLRRHDDVYRWFTARGIPVWDSRGTVVRWYGSCTDIEDRKRASDTLEQLVAERTTALTAAYNDLHAASLSLKSSNEDLERFAYVASHDLQEPLRKIQAFGDRLAKGYATALDDAGRDFIGRMLDSAGRMRRLIEDLLRFSRISTKSQTFAPVALNEVLTDTLSDLEIQIQRTRGQVHVGPLPTVPADRVQMRQLFQNLIGNALKFARPMVPPIVNVDARPHPGGWQITVRDNGIGFEAEYSERIFELFQRLHGRTEFEGTGLGLAICKKIVARHGATISARGEPGSGATFVIEWPIATIGTSYPISHEEVQPLAPAMPASP